MLTKQYLVTIIYTVGQLPIVLLTEETEVPHTLIMKRYEQELLESIIVIRKTGVVTIVKAPNRESSIILCHLHKTITLIYLRVKHTYLAIAPYFTNQII